MEDLNKLREYLEKREVASDSDNESVSSGEYIILKTDPLESPDTKLDTVDDYKDLNVNDVNYIKRCNDDTLKSAMLLNRRKKLSLIKLSNRLKIHQTGIQEQIKVLRNRTCAQLQSTKKYMKFRLGMPYFKDKDLFPCPYNEDYFKMKRNQELPLQSYYLPRIWTLADKTKLANAVYSMVCKSKRKEVEKEILSYKKERGDVIDDVLERLQNTVTYLSNEALIESVVKSWNTVKVLKDEEISVKKDEILKDIKELEEQLDGIDDVEVKKEVSEKIFELNAEKDELELKNYIVKTVSDWDKYVDWLDIASNALHERHNDVECKFMWESYMNPKFSKKSWSNEENVELTMVVRNNNMQNWERISEEMSINKSAYQCCIHFFSKLWDKYRRDKWTRDEEEYLRSVVSICQIGDYIPWGKVAKYFTHRSRNQVYTHYLFCVAPNIKKGRFTISEDILFTALLRKYQSFVKASYYFSNRQINQLRDRYKSLGESQRSWTLEDDIKILQHVQEHGDKNWNLIEIDKNSALIRHRYNVIQKWIVLNPGKSIEGVERRPKTLALRNRQFERCKIIERFVNILLEQLKEETPEKIFNIKYIEKLMKDLGEGKYLKKFTPLRPRKVNKELEERFDLESLIRDFFKSCYRFVGRSRIPTSEIVTKSTQRVKYGLNMLNAQLKIPHPETLKDNPLLDDFDIEILTKLYYEQFPALINDTITINTSIRFNAFDNLPSILNLPPEPGTLIGFRGLMLHNVTLKKNASGYFNDIHKYLPDEKNTETLLGVKCSRAMIENNLEKITENKRQVVYERDLCKKRFKALFKWPALMSLPSNQPNEPFANDFQIKKTTKPPRLNDTNVITETLKNTLNQNSDDNSIEAPKNIVYPTPVETIEELSVDMRLSPGMSIPSTNPGVVIHKMKIPIITDVHGTTQVVNKKPGRPVKRTSKIIRMNEAKRRKKMEKAQEMNKNNETAP